MSPTNVEGARIDVQLHSSKSGPAVCINTGNQHMVGVLLHDPTHG